MKIPAVEFLIPPHFPGKVTLGLIFRNNGIYITFKCSDPCELLTRSTIDKVKMKSVCVALSTNIPCWFSVTPERLRMLASEGCGWTDVTTPDMNDRELVLAFSFR
jgi:hypothetical protein